MTDGAILREIALHVIGIIGPVEITLVTAEAVSRQPRELIIDMAGGAENGGVRANQRKSGLL